MAMGRIVQRPQAAGNKCCETFRTNKCPSGQVPMVRTDPANTLKYGQDWEQGTELYIVTPPYAGNGPVCWQQCPDGFSKYRRGMPKASLVWPWLWKLAYELYCKSHAGKKTGCEKNGLLSRNAAVATTRLVAVFAHQQGMTDTGADCTKNSYGRGAVKVGGKTSDFALTVAATVVLSLAACAVAAQAVSVL